MIFAALALSSGCASGPRFRPVAPLAAANDALSAEIDGVENRVSDPGLVLAARVAAPPGTELRGAALALPGTDPCTSMDDEQAAVLAVDGRDSWRRPVPVAGQHRLTLRFPQTLGLASRLEGPMALDLATVRAGVPGCLRIAVQDERQTATWTVVSPWMLGVRIDFAALALGVRAGRRVGPVVVGLEETVSAYRSTTAALASVRVFQGFGLDVGYAAAWTLPGHVESAGTFRNGPRLRGFYGLVQSPRFDGGRLTLAGFGVEVTRWWAAGSRGAETDIVFGVGGWFSPSGL
jgi:hypothetical protein